MLARAQAKERAAKGAPGSAVDDWDGQPVSG